MTKISGGSAPQRLPEAEQAGQAEQAGASERGRKRPRELSPSAALDALSAIKRPRMTDEAAPRVRAQSLPPRMASGAHVPLSDLIGKERATALDENFGSLQPPRAKNGGIHAWERHADGSPMTHDRRVALTDAKSSFPEMRTDEIRKAVDLEALKRGEKRYVWAASALGRIFVGEEIPAGTDPETGKARHAGHPLLVAGGPARICGELTYDAARDALLVNNKSGRYSRYEDRDASQLKNALDILSRAFTTLGVRVESEHVTGKAIEPLVRPTLARK